MKRNIIFSILFTYIFWGCSGSSSSHSDEHEHQHSDHIEAHDHNHDEHEGHDHALFLARELCWLRREMK